MKEQLLKEQNPFQHQIVVRLGENPLSAGMRIEVRIGVGVGIEIGTEEHTVQCTGWEHTAQRIGWEHTVQCTGWEHTAGGLGSR